MLAYVWYARRPGLARWLLVTAALALGLMCKPMLVTWPLVFLLLDYWPLRRVKWPASGETSRTAHESATALSQSQINAVAMPQYSPSWLLLEKLPLLPLVAAAAAVTFILQRLNGTHCAVGIRADCGTDRTRRPNFM